MCGRYTTVTKIKAIEKRFNVQASQPLLYEPNTNISHGEYAPVITGDKPHDLQFFQFGLTPAWAKKQFYMINARAEGDHNKQDDPSYTGEMGIVNKPMFRKSIRSQRCLIVADCFIEGPQKEKLNMPYVVYLRNGERPFAMAGIWDCWVNEMTGELINSFAVITTVSNDLMTQIGHHRSPVILNPDEEQNWIDPSLPLAEVTSLLKPFPAERLNGYPISSDIKNPRLNGSQLLEPTGQRIYKEYDFEIYKEIEVFGMGESRARNRKKNEDEQGQLF